MSTEQFYSPTVSHLSSQPLPTLNLASLLCVFIYSTSLFEMWEAKQWETQLIQNVTVRSVWSRHRGGMEGCTFAPSHRSLFQDYLSGVSISDKFPSKRSYRQKRQMLHEYDQPPLLKLFVWFIMAWSPVCPWCQLGTHASPFSIHQAKKPIAPFFLMHSD